MKNPYLNKKGSVLMISLWILAILVVFTLGLGHRAAINLRLARYQRDRLKATYLARAGINQAKVELQKDAKDNAYDGLNETWSGGFENIEIVEGSDEKFTAHITDEEGKININSIDTPEKEQILVKLFEIAEIEKPEDLKNLILKWISSDVEPEDNEHIFKNSQLKYPEELLVILEYFYGKDNSQKTRESYNKIKNLITVYGSNVININTASEDVLITVARSISDDEGLIRNVTGKILGFREGDNGPFKDMNSIDDFYTNLPTEEKPIFEPIKANSKVSSQYFRIGSQGNVGNIIKNIIAIYERDSDNMVYWHGN